jgi:hypothetical protein
MSQRVSNEQLKAALALQIARLVAQGRIIESQTDNMAVLLRRNRLVTWREVASIDESGHFTLEKLPLERDQIVRLAALGVSAAIVILVLILSAVD